MEETHTYCWTGSEQAQLQDALGEAPSSLFHLLSKAMLTSSADSATAAAWCFLVACAGNVTTAETSGTFFPG